MTADVGLFGKQWRLHRQRVRLTQRELADRLRLDFTYISKIEGGKVPPPAREKIEAAAKVFKLSRGESDAFLALAEKVPSDLASWVVNQPDALRLYRGIHQYPAREQEEILARLIEQVERGLGKHRSSEDGA